MRNRRLTTWAILGLLMVGCNKNEPSVDNDESGVDNGGLISFSLSADADWTKGAVVNDISEVEALQVYSYATTANWAESAINPYFTDDIETPFVLTQDNGTWTYNIGSRYWPADGRLLSFFAYYPESDLAVSTDDDGRPEYSYTLNSLSRYNNDLLVNATYDLTKESNGGDLVTLAMQHALTKITLQVKLKGDLNDDGAAYSTEYDNYIVNGIVFYDIYDNAILTIDEDGAVSWEVNTENLIELSATQGQTLLSVENSDAILNNESYTDVMIDGQAMFVLPQSLSAVREAADEVVPTAKVRIRRIYYAAPDGDPIEKIYESELVTIPAPTVAEISGGTGTGCWDAGQHVKYSFEFDITQLEEYNTPLTITSEVLSWTEAPVTADIHSNLYVYSSVSNIAVSVVDDTVDEAEREYYGDFQVCTNYDYNLRVPHHREELGGTITSSRGFVFCSNSFVGMDGINSVDEFESGGYTYQIFVPTLLSTYNGVTREIVYVTETNIAGYSSDSPIYEYPDDNGYNGTRSVETIGVANDIIFGSNGYGYIFNEENELYRLLYLDPKEGYALTAFNYDNNEVTGYHEIKLTNFADDNNTVNFIIKISDVYSFDFSVTRSDRETEGLYVSTAIATNGSYGVNKEGDDPVYTLRLSVDPTHLLKAYSADDEYDEDTGYYYGSFEDIIGVEMISNGGGMITTYFHVTLSDSEDVIRPTANDLVASLLAAAEEDPEFN